MYNTEGNEEKIKQETAHSLQIIKKKNENNRVQYMNGIFVHLR